MYNFISVQLCLTYNCQCHCQHCGVANLAHTIKDELSLDQIQRIFENLKLSGVSGVDLSGGEPTLRKDLAEIIHLGKRYGFTMLLETNGLDLDDEVISNFKKSGLDLMYLSLDDYRLARQDRNRRGKGAFVEEVSTLRRARKIGLPVHVSIVPMNQEFFTSGEADEHITFCLKNGAEKIRILFPSYVGNCRPTKQTSYSEEQEIFLLGHISAEYYDSVYVEGPGSPLRVVLEERRVPCPAKREFCYISPNGYVMPCPYLPIAFGDIKREPIIEIFSRMQDHPFLKHNGSHCPTRDEKYVATCLAGVNKDSPFKFIKSSNRVNCFSLCNNNCDFCSLPKRQEDTQQLMERIGKVDKQYRSIHLYGGEIFTRNDALSIIQKASNDFEVILYSNARILADRSLAKKISTFNIKAVKVPFFSFNEKKFEEITGVKKSFRQTLMGLINLARVRVPVSVYIPEDEVQNKRLEFLISLGVVSISSYAMGHSNILPDTVLCFGSRLRHTRLLWLKR